MGFERGNTDFHIHSKYSPDGHLEPKKIISLAMENGLKTIAVTDHNTIKGGRKTKEVAKAGKTNLQVVVGAEINTDEGEIIGLGLKEEIQPSGLDETINQIKGQGGKVYVPHPFDRFRSSALGNSTLKIIDKINYLEVFNGRCLLNSFDRKAKEFAEKRGLAELAGSDTHFGFEMGNLSPGVGRFTKALWAHILTKTAVGK